MKKTLAAAAAVALCVLFVACKSDKVPAQAAITAAEQAVAAVSADAKQFVPDQLKGVQDALAAAKDKFAKGDYTGALAAANELAGRRRSWALPPWRRRKS